MSNIAKKIIIPEASGLLRAIFLYVGQGDATLLVVPDAQNYKFILIDSSNDESAGGIDLVKMFKDLFKGGDQKLDIYINTHPHSDHLAKVRDIYDEIGFDELWHSGHTPGGDHKESYKDLEYVMGEIGNQDTYCLKGSRDTNKLDDQDHPVGDVNYNILAPAKYVSDDVDKDKPDARYQRIHEQCGVIKFSYGENEKQILITGDADYNAWKEYITDYHKDRLLATVLSAAHHGSNSFFWKNSDTESDIYKDHITAINPSYVVVSAPKRKESKHNHPDKEALEQYDDIVGGDCVFHLGDKRECIIVDIDASGDIDVYPDDELVKEYGSDNGNSGNAIKVAPAVITKIDNKPMG